LFVIIGRFIRSFLQGIKCKINCMAIEDPKTIYSLILSDLEGRNDSRLPGTPSRSQRHLEKLEKLLQQSKAVKYVISSALAPSVD
jgi:Cdc6-like AAA superfamily ATPase